jgi:anti-sigma B factor antagonist
MDPQQTLRKFIVADDETPLVKYEAYGPITVGTLYNTSMLDGMTVTNFGNQVVKYVEQNPGIQLMLNFQNVKYLSSAALTELIRIADAAKAGNGKVRLCNLCNDIEKVFEITKFDKLFEIHKGEPMETSLKKFRRSVEISQEEAAWEERNKNF